MDNPKESENMDNSKESEKSDLIVSCISFISSSFNNNFSFLSNFSFC